ncbi:MAG TPA: SdiA-regulated domain-containing protein [Flavobacteriales bacterium]|nr:SdiA-regulated domain-containing protein [Flavobacteriales bacterium]
MFTVQLKTLAIGAYMAVGGSALPFHLNKPDRNYTLSPELREISALTDVDEYTVACVQDEQAMIYMLDLRKGTIIQRMPFGPAGDMEGLTRVGDEYFALRSDGLVYRLALKPEAVSVLVLDSFHLELPNRNLEGLGYDERKGLVLISPKDFLKGEAGLRDRRVVYAYDPRNKRLLAEPVLSLSVSGVEAQARAMGIEVPTRTNDKGQTISALKLRFSSVAVDPRSELYYLLSAVDRMLLVVDREAKLVSLQQLDAKLFPKPEGITFLPSGDLLISNEGKGMPPNLLRFKRHSLH